MRLGAASTTVLLAASSALAAGAGGVAPAAAATEIPVVEFDGPGAEGFATAIAAGEDGSMWVAHGDGTFVALRPEADNPRRVRRTVARVPRAGAYPGAMAVADDEIWFTEQLGNRIGRIAAGGTVTEYPLPHAGSGPTGIVLGPDRALWFTEQLGDRIGRITRRGEITEYPLPNPGSGPTGIAVGPDRALWFTQQFGNRIGRISVEGAISEYALPRPASGPRGITVGPDRALWFTEQFGGRIGRISTDARHTIVEHSLRTAFPDAIALGTDGALWFTAPTSRVLGRVRVGTRTRTRITEFAVPSDASGPTAVTSSCDGRVWFTQLTGEVGAIGPYGPDRCRPAHVADDPTGGAVTVLGPSRLTATQLASWYRSTRNKAHLAPGTDIEALARVFLEEASAVGVRADLAFAQSMLETGFLDFPARGQVRPDDNNFAGLGACDSCTRGRIFPTTRDGVRAQMQHLRNYADGSSRAGELGFRRPRGGTGADPQVAARNFDTFFAKGRAPTWLEMGDGNWATDPGYRGKILRIYQQMLTFASS